jgi:hypothetical protein
MYRSGGTTSCCVRPLAVASLVHCSFRSLQFFLPVDSVSSRQWVVEPESRAARCIRVIRNGNKAFIVSIPGAQAAWVKNIRANSEVRLRIRDGRFGGVACELGGSEEMQEARATYCETVNPFDYAECSVHRRGLPTRSKIMELHRNWFEGGLPMVVELRSER